MMGLVEVPECCSQDLGYEPRVGTERCFPKISM